MRTITLILLAFSLNACIPDVSGDTTIDNSVTYGEGTVLVCTDSICEVAAPGSDVDVVVGEYNPDYNQIECNAAGFFYCTVANMCLDQPEDGGTCSI